MTATELDRDRAAPRVIAQLLPFSAVTFLGFLAIGVPLPVLPSFVHDRLGYGAVMVGAVVGLHPLATLLTRQLAGWLADVIGPKRTTLAGFVAATVAGICYLGATRLAIDPPVALAALLLGRVMLGLGESLFITALAAWSIIRVGAANAGRAMAWSGIAMYGAMAIGAPLGVALESAHGFAAAAASAVITPVLAVLYVLFWADAPCAARRQDSFLRAVRSIWMPGLAMALASFGVGTITAFLTLRFRAAGWSGAGFALSGFGAAYIAMRLLFGGLPDRFGYRAAVVSLVVEASGLFAIWAAPSVGPAFGGAVLCGLGYSLVFPALGVEALRSAQGVNRGLVLGAYLACFDLGLAVAGPTAGAVIARAGLPAAFAAAGCAALAGLAMALVAQRRARRT